MIFHKRVWERPNENETGWTGCLLSRKSSNRGNLSAIIEEKVNYKFVIKINHEMITNKRYAYVRNFHLDAQSNNDRIYSKVFRFKCAFHCEIRTN